MDIVSKSQALKLIQGTKGKVFSAVFLKKNGDERTINARLGVNKGVNGAGLKYDPLSKGYLPIYDMANKGYRMLNLTTLKAIQVNKKVYVVSK